MAASSIQPKSAVTTELDAVVIGAGFGGMYALHSLRELGLKVRVYDEAGGVGGTWWWNRYPGARVDFPGGPFYCYTFSEELVREWDWTERQPDQAAVLGYLNFVADKFDLHRDIQLRTRVTAARFDEVAQRWLVEISDGSHIRTQFLICAVGTLSAAHMPDIPGVDRFVGECFHTGRWPHDKVQLAGKRIGIIGTGSSGVQAIPQIAREAAHLTVFQRTPQYSIPAGNCPIDQNLVQQARAHWPELRQRMKESQLGSPFAISPVCAREHTPEQRRAVFETYWQNGGLGILFESYRDILTDKDANDTLSEFVREKIRAQVRDPEIARKLMPDYLLGTKRQIMDEGYYETFNQTNVTLVDLRDDPIVEITPGGVRTQSGEHALDMLIFATGFDAITGALQRLNPRGRNGVALQEQWAERFNTYLGVTIPNFPNLFMIHGPESPCVLFNMPLGAELEGDWIRDCVRYLREHRLAAIEPAPGVEHAWGQQVEEVASHTLFPLTSSWYTGGNIPGKHRQFAVHLGGPDYFASLSRVAAQGYAGFVLEAENSTQAAAG